MPASRKPKPAANFGSFLPDLATRVAAARRRAGLTLARTAERTGLSPAYLSQIESGRANPTVRTLAEIAAALDTDVPSLFGSPVNAEDSFPAYWSPAARAAELAGLPGTWDRTAAGSHRLVARLVHGDAGDHATPVAHPGEEFLLVLRGRCRLHVDGATRAMSAGDACHYDAAQPHHLDEATADLTVSVVMSEDGTMGL